MYVSELHIWRWSLLFPYIHWAFGISRSLQGGSCGWYCGNVRDQADFSPFGKGDWCCWGVPPPLSMCFGCRNSGGVKVISTRISRPNISQEHAASWCQCYLLVSSCNSPLRRHDATIQWVKQRANTSEGRVKPKVSVDERTVCIHILKKPQKHYERNEVQLKSWSDQLVLIIKQEKDELEIMGNFTVW